MKDSEKVTALIRQAKKHPLNDGATHLLLEAIAVGVRALLEWKEAE